MTGNQPRRAVGFRMDLAIVAVLLGLIVAPLWSNAPGVVPEAAAQIPDTGLQRKLLIDEQRRTNELLSQILDVLQNRTIKVESAASEKERGAGSRGGVR